MAKTTKELIAEIEELKAQIEQQEEPEAEAEETSEEETSEEETSEAEAEESDNEDMLNLQREIKSLKKEMTSLTKEVVKAKSQRAENVQTLPAHMSSDVKQDEFGNYYAEWNYDVFINSNLR